MRLKKHILFGAVSLPITLHITSPPHAHPCIHTHVNIYMCVYVCACALCVSVRLCVVTFISISLFLFIYVFKRKLSRLKMLLSFDNRENCFYWNESKNNIWIWFPFAKVFSTKRLYTIKLKLIYWNVVW